MLDIPGTKAMFCSHPLTLYSQYVDNGADRTGSRSSSYISDSFHHLFKLLQLAGVRNPGHACFKSCYFCFILIFCLIHILKIFHNNLKESGN